MITISAIRTRGIIAVITIVAGHIVETDHPVVDRAIPVAGPAILMVGLATRMTGLVLREVDLVCRIVGMNRLRAKENTRRGVV